MARKSFSKKATTPRKTDAKKIFQTKLSRVTEEKNIPVDRRLAKSFREAVDQGLSKQLRKIDRENNSVERFLLSVISDLFEKIKNLEQERDQRTDAYEDVIALITHEFKNILTSVNGYNMMLEGQLIKSNEQKALKILESSDRLTRQLFVMSDSLLKMSLGEKGLLEPELRLINIMEDLLKPIKEDLKQAAREKHITIVTDRTSKGPVVMGDDGLLDIVFRNLIINAIKYGKDYTDILLSVTREDEDCIVRVKNECEKLPDNFCENIFNKFTKKIVGNKKGGTGLGLYNVKKIIDLHHGQVFCRISRQKFIEFEIRLPQNNI